MSEETCPDCGLPTWHSRMACLEAQLSAATARASELETKLEQAEVTVCDIFGELHNPFISDDKRLLRLVALLPLTGKQLDAGAALVAKRDAELSALGERVARAEREWLLGSPEVGGQYWIYWRTMHDEWRVETVSIGPAVFSKTGALLLKLSSGAAFQYEPNRRAITHYMPIEAAPLPPRGT